MPSQADVDYDVGIIGGGPAGASLAAYLARAGVSCVVFESALFPRPHVGESLVPSSTRVFKELDFLDVMEAARFPRKYGAVWTSSQSARAHEHSWLGLAADCRADIRFDERDQPGVDQNYTYHVDRGLFDNLLLQHAHSSGAEVMQGVSVHDVRFAEGEAPELRFALGKREVGCRVRIVADASGRRTLLGNRLRLKRKDPQFDQFAIHTWFEGFDRLQHAEGGAGTEDHIHVHFLPISNSWLWQIPITEHITSVGVVTQRTSFAGSRASREAFFWECAATRPALHDALRAAQQVRPFVEEGDYSYAMDQVCGDGWLMVGDAGRFVDPIFSTGVSIALNSSRLAHRDIVQALETGHTGKSAFAEYERTIRRGTNNWYNFISLYYRLNVLFTYFIGHPDYRLDVLKLLQGDVYDEDEPPVLAAMKARVAEVEGNPQHPLHGYLGSLTANAFRPAF